MLMSRENHHVGPKRIPNFLYCTECETIYNEQVKEYRLVEKNE